MTSNIPVWSKAKLGTKLSIIAFVPFVLTSVCILATLAVLSDAYAEARYQQRARQMISDCETAMDSMIMGGGLMGFYLRTRDPKTLEQFWQTGTDTEVAINDLRENAKEQPPELVALIEQLAQHTDRVENEARDGLDIYYNPRRGQSLLDLMNFRAKTLTLIAREKELIDRVELGVNAQMAKQPVQHSPLYLFLRHNVVLAVGVSIFGSLSLALLLARSIVGRLHLLTQKAIRLALLEAPEIKEKGSDEIAQVDHVFNDMAFQLLNAIKREQAAIACAADAIISIGPDGRVQAANSALTGGWGWKPEELVGKPIADFVPNNHQGLLQQAVGDRAAQAFEADLLTSGKQSKPCLWSTSWSPGEQCTIAIVHDVTERKAAEEKLQASEARTRNLMEHMPAGLLLIGNDGVIRFANGTACALLHKSGEQLLGCQFTSLLSAANFESPNAFVELMSQRAQAYVAAVTRDGEPDGRVQLSLSKFGRTDSQQLYLIVMVDYTQRWQFEELRQRLVAMIAHDIATPLMTVQNTLGMASSGMFGQLRQGLDRDISESEKQSGDILQTFKNVVRFQKLASGFSSLSAAQLPLQELTGQALDVVAEQAQVKSLQLENSLQDSCDLAATGDADKLAVLGATLLQTVVDCAGVTSRIIIDGYKEPGFACWRLSVKDRQPPAARERAYFSEIDVFESGGAGTGDLDLILWRLLLYQCQAKVSFEKSTDGYDIILRMPFFQPQPAASAAAIT